MEQIIITEITPRDGWQSVEEYIPAETKLRLISGMLDAGIQRLQAGSFVSPKAIPQLRDSGEIIPRLLERYPGKSLFALVPNLRGATAAHESGLREIACVVSVSESHNKANINRTVEQSLEELREIRRSFPDTVLNLDTACAFGCPFEGETPLDALLCFLDKAVEIGVDSIDLCDTVGVAYPAQVERVLRAVMDRFPGLPLDIHIHDTRGLGILNTWIAIEMGVARIQTALGGLGGCPFAPGASGNTATEDLVYLLHKNGIETGIDFPALLALSKEMYGLVGGNYSGHHLHIRQGEPCTAS